MTTSPRSTRQQRLDHAAELTKEKIAIERRKLAAVESAQRAEQRKARDRRRYHVGTLCDACGVLDLDDAVLRPLLSLLSGVSSTPNPVALLEALLPHGSGSPGTSVEGMATAAQCVSRAD